MIPNTQPRVLIVDDHAEILELTEQLVERAYPGMQVAVAHDGPQAMDYLSEAARSTGDNHLISGLVLLDIKMPGADGFEVLQWVRNNEALANIKVVMLSNSESAADVERATGLGACGYLIKIPTPSLLACLFLSLWGAPAKPKRAGLERSRVPRPTELSTQPI